MDTQHRDVGDPAAFYTGLVARLYGALKSTATAVEPYANLIDSYGEPALELGCGDGEPLLALRRLGLEVEGVDSSADMLARLHGQAAAEGLDVVTHLARFEDLDLERRFRLVFLAGPTFNLLPDDAAALAALRSIARHLAPDGVASVPLFVPDPTPKERFGVRQEVEVDGSLMRLTYVAETYDGVARRRETVLRYELAEVGGRTDVPAEVVERTWLLHWYPRDVFTALAREAGLAVVSVSDEDGAPVGPDENDVTVLLEHA